MRIEPGASRGRGDGPCQPGGLPGRGAARPCSAQEAHRDRRFLPWPYYGLTLTGVQATIIPDKETTT